MKEKGNKRAGRREETENWGWMNKGDGQNERGTPQNRDTDKDTLESWTTSHLVG